MRPLVLTMLLVGLLAPFTRADDTPTVRVQFTYVDTSFVGQAVEKFVPPPHKTAGDALLDFGRNLTKAFIRHKITPGPTALSPSGVRFALDKGHTVPEASMGRTGADFLIGPVLTLTPSVVKDDLVSVVLSINDQEIVGPAGYWFPKPELVNAHAPSLFKAHSGSTVFLGAAWSSPKIERFTFATVTILGQKKAEIIRDLRSRPLPALPPPIRNAQSPAPIAPAAALSPAPTEYPTCRVQITDIDVPADLVFAVSDAMNDPVNRHNRLLILTQEAAKQHRPIVVMPGVQGSTLPRSPQGIEPLDGDKLSSADITKGTFFIREGTLIDFQGSPIPGHLKDQVTQTLSVAGRMKAEGTAVLDLILHEKINAVPGQTGGLLAAIDRRYQAKSLTFHSGETKVLSEPSRGGGIVHMIFATVTILPPPK